MACFACPPLTVSDHLVPVLVARIWHGDPGSLVIRLATTSPGRPQRYSCGVLPPFDPDTGRLPVGVHEATWDEVVDRFGWNPRRRQLLDGFADAVDALTEVGCRRVWLNGSFVTAKEEPADFDACWDSEGVDFDVDRKQAVEASVQRLFRRRDFPCAFRDFSRFDESQML